MEGDMLPDTSPWSLIIDTNNGLSQFEKEPKPPVCSLASEILKPFMKNKELVCHSA